MSQVTVREAAKLTGKSRETINTATKQGTISFTLNSRKHKVIEVVELERVFPLIKSMAEINEKSDDVSSRALKSESDSSESLALLRQKLTASEAMQEVLASERERERRQLESEIENLRASLEKSQEQQNKALLLITDQSHQAKERGGDWEATVRKLKQKIANQETELESSMRDLRENAKRELIDERNNKAWWELVFK